MERKYFINTDLGYKDITDKIVEDGYQYIDENRLINPKPMIFDYKELQWLKENLNDFVKKSYPQISKETLERVGTITTDELKSRPYIFTGFFRGLDEDVYLIKIKDAESKLYNIYLVKYETWSEDEDISNYGIIQKIRFENEEWYRNFFSNEDDYNKNKYSDNKTNSTKEKISNSRYNTLLGEEEKKIYKTFEGKSYTFEEWKDFEKEQYKIYKEKQNKKGFWDNLFG